MDDQPTAYEDPQVRTKLLALKQQLATLEGRTPAAPSEATLHQLLAAVETMQLGVTIADESGVILYANPAQARMYDVETPEDLIGKEVSIFCLPGYRERLTPDRLGHMKSWRRESVNVRKDGSLVPVRLLSDVLRGPDGEPMGVITTCEDLTEVKLAETERNRLQLQVQRSHALAPEATNAGAGTLEAAAPETVSLEAVPKDPSLSAAEVAPDGARLPAWFPVSFGRDCPSCGGKTRRTRTAWYARPLRFFLRRRCSTRECVSCYWKALTLHRK